MGEVKIGLHSYGEINRRGSDNNILIGSYTQIAENVIFDSGFNHNYRSVSTYPFHRLKEGTPDNIGRKGDIYIGSDVWIGMDAVIMAGVKIYDGAVIGARTIVTRDVLPYSIVAGAPMKLLKHRFTPKQIGELLEIKWWNWNYEKVLENIHLLQGEDIDKFISLHYKP